ncbi:MAG: GDSL-type esterase/lipase family protein [Thiogranum sp.]
MIDGKWSFYETHEKLGYVTASNWRPHVNHTSSRTRTVTTLDYGVRSNDNGNVVSESTTLAIGDSFTFGDGVDYDRSWPSCLERRLGKQVINAGVNGYGTAQALLRGEILLEKIESVDTVILSVLVGHDIDRDTLEYRSGRARPYLDRIDGEIDYVFPEKPDAKGTRQNPRWHILQYFALYQDLSRISDILPDTSATNLTRRSSADVTHAEIICFVLNRFNEFSSQKVLLLQYASELNNDHVTRERHIWLDTAGDFPNIQLVDLYQELTDRKKTDSNRIWFGRFGHHTPHGNTIVCEYLKSRLSADR